MFLLNILTLNRCTEMKDNNYSPVLERAFLGQPKNFDLLTSYGYQYLGIFELYRIPSGGTSPPLGIYSRAKNSDILMKKC